MPVHPPVRSLGRPSICDLVTATERFVVFFLKFGIEFHYQKKKQPKQQEFRENGLSDILHPASGAN
jgi:hypothetical protein